uniref:Uncharacterized protein n=1 Tax=Loxodonta africana TaxID=9785 RepID=G3UD74_LOXAF
MSSQDKSLNFSCSSDYKISILPHFFANIQTHAVHCLIHKLYGRLINL